MEIGLGSRWGGWGRVSGALVVGGLTRGGGWGRCNSYRWFDHVFWEGVEGAQALKELAP